jgi:hypothetical protein
MTEKRGHAVKRLVDKAERRMRDSVDAEIEVSADGRFHENVDIHKYEEAKKMFEEALQLDPGNPRAIRGISDCDEMLRGYVPVQRIARVARPVDASMLEPAAAGPNTKQGHSPPKKMPWEASRERRQRDREGMAYTTAMFGKEREAADAKVDAIIAEALERAKMEPGAAKVIRDAAANEIGEFQSQLHRGWKGHGPEILDAAIAKLNAAFKRFKV